MGKICYLWVLLFFFMLASCLSHPLPLPSSLKNQVRYHHREQPHLTGYVNTTDLGDHLSLRMVKTAPASFQTQALDLTAMKYVRMWVRGAGITDKIWNQEGYQDVSGNPNNITLQIPSVPSGKNRIVSAQAYDINKQPIPGVLVKAFYSSSSTGNRVILNLEMRYLAIGKILECLLDSGSSLVNGLDANALQNLLDKTLYGNNPIGGASFATHPRLLDACGIATTIQSNNGSLPQVFPLIFQPELVGWWPGEGNANDGSSTYHGSLLNGVTFAPGKVGQAFGLNGVNQRIEIPDAAALNPTIGISVTGWVNSAYRSQSDIAQTVASKWRSQTTFNSFSSYDAGNTDGANGNKGHAGAIFDGRYVYFVPFLNGGPHGKILRYDTQANFTTGGSWLSYDASNTDGANGNKGYGGAVYDGRYIYFVPNDNGAGVPHGKVLRYDTQADFTTGGSWLSYDASNTDGANGNKGYIGAAFDGRYIYFVPTPNGIPHGRVLRYDTQTNFTTGSSWVSYDASNTDGANGTKGYGGAVFDGRYVYFVPNNNGVSHGKVLRYDTQANFTTGGSWLSYDASNTDGANGNKGYVGAAFDGRYIYFVPNSNGGVSHGKVLRYDTQANFTTGSSWVSYDASNTDGVNGNKGYGGAVYDGRYVYFVPYLNGGIVAHGKVLRYDTQANFTTGSSWASFDAGNTDGANGTKGYVCATFDGRYVYFAPFLNGGFHGKVLRYDTTGTEASWHLSYTNNGHNGGMTASLPGTTFRLNTSNGALSISAHSNINPGWHHLVGTYDGAFIRLYIDGALVKQQSGTGTIVTSPAKVVLGAIENGGEYFKGLLDEVQIYNRALTPSEILAIYNATQ